MKLIFLLIIWLALCRFVNAQNIKSFLGNDANIPNSELEALHDLFVSTNGNNWNWTTSPIAGKPWVFTPEANPCEDHWQGIDCGMVINDDGYRNVIQLKLDHHNLEGGLPCSITNLTQLQELDLEFNSLSGSLPKNIGNLTNLLTLKLAINNLNGTLPQSLGNFQKIEKINLFDNKFTGTIPSTLGNLHTLQFIDVQLSSMEGSLPESLANMLSLKYMAFDVNALTGTVPQFICNFTNIELFSLYDNYMHGEIPECLGNLPKLKFLYLGHNHITGTIPSSFNSAQSFITLWLQVNVLWGPIPDFVAAENTMTHLLLEGNYLSGTLPAALSNAKSMLVLSLRNNSLLGTIPPSYGEFYNLKHLELNHNSFEGPIPATFSQMSALTELYLQNNKLSGGLDGVFNSTMQTELGIIQLSDNRLTGTLPDELFVLPNLQTLALVSNCLEGTLPRIMCKNLNAYSYILDGMQTAPFCRQDLLPGSPSAYVVPNHFRGTVPACLLSMPNLTSLHISGNGLTGSLPPDLVVSDRLVDLTISHNALTGTIPQAIQERQWSTLDLSFNRLTGSLIPDFGTRAVDLVIVFEHTTYLYNQSEITIDLQNNRLSGTVPEALIGPRHYKVLGTNMFSCKSDKSDLPQYQKSSYECGSDSFNAPYYAWLALVCTTAALIILLLRYRKRIEQIKVIRNALECLHKWTQDKGELPRNFKNVSAMSDILCKLSVWCTVLILVVLLPWYSAASQYFGTYTHQYAWVVSAAFLSGHTPLQAEIVFYMVLMVALVAGLAYLLTMYDRKEHFQPSRYETRSEDGRYVYTHITPASFSQRLVIYVAFATINTAVVLGFNIAFIYVALYENNTLLIVAQVVLSAFKLLWNSMCTPRLIRYIAEYVSTSNLGTGFVTIQVIMALFNNIAIPGLVTAAVSPACFNSIFVRPPTINSATVFEACLTVRNDGNCHKHVDNVLLTSYNPPFRYDYQCSSSFVTYYAPAFVYLAIAAAFATPAIKVIGHLLYKHATPGSYWFMLLHRMLPRIQKPLALVWEPAADSTRNSTSSAASSTKGRADESGSVTGSVDGSAKGSVNGSNSVTGSSSSQKSANGSITGVSVGNSVVSYDTFKRNVLSPYFDANIHIISLMTYLGILLTFGVVFPPLSVAMSVTMISVAWQGRLAVGRFLYNAREAGALKFVDIIEQECKGAVTIPKIRMCIFIIICFSCTFYALFLYDTLGDAVGQSGAYWTLIVMPLFPVLIYAVILIRRRRRGGLLLGLKMDAAAAMQTEGVPLSALEECHRVHGNNNSVGSFSDATSSVGSFSDSGRQVAKDYNGGGSASSTFNILRV